MILAQSLSHELTVKLWTGASASSESSTEGDPVPSSYMWSMAVSIPHGLLPKTLGPLHVTFSIEGVNVLKTWQQAFPRENDPKEAAHTQDGNHGHLQPNLRKDILSLLLYAVGHTDNPGSSSDETTQGVSTRSQVCWMLATVQDGDREGRWSYSGRMSREDLSEGMLWKLRPKRSETVNVKT